MINEWKRMHAMDVSDVSYERFLLNGKPIEERSALAFGKNWATLCSEEYLSGGVKEHFFGLQTN